MGISKSIRKGLAKMRGWADVDDLEYLRRLEAGEADVSEHDAGHGTRPVLKIVDPARRIAFALESFRDATQKELLRGGWARYRGLLDAIETFSEPGTDLLDVGANVGAVTLFCARLFGGDVKVHAFEPSPVSAPRLRRNVALNRAANVTIYEFGLGAKEGKFDFHMEREGSTNTGLSTFVAEARHKAADVVQAEMRTLDSMRTTFRRVSVMKLDTQGNEADVLEGGRALIADQRPVILFEHDDDFLKDAASARRKLREFFAGIDYETFLFSRKDPSLLLAANWDRAIRGDLLAVPK